MNFPCQVAHAFETGQFVAHLYRRVVAQVKLIENGLIGFRVAFRGEIDDQQNAGGLLLGRHADRFDGIRG